MKAIIEIKEITLNQNDIYNISSYKDDGFYLVTNDFGYKLYVLAIKTNLEVHFIAEYNDAKLIFKNEFDIKQEIKSVSESFALKAISIAISGDMVDCKDINPN